MCSGTAKNSLPTAHPFPWLSFEVFNVTQDKAGKYDCRFPVHNDIDRSFNVVVEGWLSASSLRFRAARVRLVLAVVRRLERSRLKFEIWLSPPRISFADPKALNWIRAGPRAIDFRAPPRVTADSARCSNEVSQLLSLIHPPTDGRFFEKARAARETGTPSEYHRCPDTLKGSADRVAMTWGHNRQRV